MSGLVNGRWSRVLQGLAVASLAGSVFGCNLVTGADGLVLGDGSDDATTSGPGSTSSTTGGAGGTAGAGGAGTGAGETGPGGGPPQGDSAPVDGVSITGIKLYQSVERPLMEGGSPVSSSTPVVANREGLVRVFYTVDGSYNGQPVFARLMLDGQDPMEVEVTPSGTSQDGTLNSTINFDVPPGALTVGGGYRVELIQSRELSSGANASATYPTTPDAFESTGAQTSATLKITLVPVQYNADGSGRLPDTSAAQLQRYEDLFYAMYPITDIDLTVRSQALSWNSTISSNGNGWSSLLDAIADLRNSDGASFDTYYYGIFEPASSAQNFCGGGCVAGLGFVGGPSDGWSHSAIGLGFTGDMAPDTAVHELGHNHGRSHAPCGNVSGADGNYPYNNGALGSWGYNILSGALYDPSSYKDMMGYCNPTWISDYNFEKIFDRVEAVSGAASWFVPDHLANRTYTRARVEPDGSLTWLSNIMLERPPTGVQTAVTVETNAGPEQTTASFIPYDHIEGGVLFIPPTGSPLVNGGLLEANVNGVAINALMPTFQ